MKTPWICLWGVLAFCAGFVTDSAMTTISKPDFERKILENSKSDILREFLESGKIPEIVRPMSADDNPLDRLLTLRNNTVCAMMDSSSNVILCLRYMDRLDKKVARVHICRFNICTSKLAEEINSEKNSPLLNKSDDVDEF